MEEKFNNKLTVTAEDGSLVNISVLDIIDSENFNKTFIIYTLEDDESTVFASILNETETSYSLDTINDAMELNFVNSEIEKIVNEEDVEE